MNEPRPYTLYEHFKGGRYIVIGVARHSDDPDFKFVVYMSMMEPGQFWVRPLDDWNTPVILHPDGSVCRGTDNDIYHKVIDRFKEVK